VEDNGVLPLYSTCSIDTYTRPSLTGEENPAIGVYTINQFIVCGRTDLDNDFCQFEWDICRGVLKGYIYIIPLIAAVH